MLTYTDPWKHDAVSWKVTVPVSGVAVCGAYTDSVTVVWVGWANRHAANIPIPIPANTIDFAMAMV